MRFLVDECTGPSVARWLREQRHDVLSIYDEARGIDDGEIVRRAFAEDRILVTNDKGLGKLGPLAPLGGHYAWHQRQAPTGGPCPAGSTGGGDQELRATG